MSHVTKLRLVKHTYKDFACINIAYKNLTTQEVQ